MHERTAGGLTIMVCERSDSDSVRLFPELLRRVRAFCAEYDSDAEIATMEDALWANFASRAPSLYGMLLLNDHGVVLGHLIVAREDWMGCQMATIIQLESDVPLSDEVLDPAYAWVKAYAIASGAEHLQCLARKESLARLFRMRYGFEHKRTLMRLRLRPRAGTGDAASAPAVPLPENGTEVTT